MKIVVIYATAGAGHRKAAEAIYHAFGALPGHDVMLVDALKYTNRFFQFSYSQGYTFLITKMSWLWGFFFLLLNLPSWQPLVRFLRRAHNSLHTRHLERFLCAEQFDYIFSTHFLPNEVAGYLKEKGVIRSQLICAITDYDVHKIWLNDAVDRYAVATDWTRQKMEQLGIWQDKIAVTGIPVELAFGQTKNIADIRQRLGLKEGECTVLIATGSFGIGPIADILDHLDGFQVMVVCGHNRELFTCLAEREKELVKIFGLVNNMDELMAAADVMVTKPGGLSISEALVVGLPMIFFNAIPGQEENNVRVLQMHGIGFDSRQVTDIVRVLRRLKTFPEELGFAKEKTKSLGKPLAALDIVRLLT